MITPTPQGLADHLVNEPGVVRLLGGREPWVKPRLFKFQVDKHLHLISPIDGPVAAMRAMIEYKEFHR